MIRILYFGNLPDLLGRAMEETALPAGVADVSGLIAALAARGEAWSRVLGKPDALKITVDKRFADPGTPVSDGAEVAFAAFIGD